MVVRSTIYSLITLMPYSDHIPDPILGILKTTADATEPDSVQDVETPAECPPTPQQIIHSRLLDKRCQNQNSSDSGSATLAESELVGSDSATDYINNAMMQKYLEDQNCKFDELIDKNLDAVLRQQTQFEEDAFWKGLIFDLTQNALGRNPMFRATTLVGRAMKHALGFVPFTGDTAQPTKETLEMEERQAQLQEILGPLDYRTKVELLRQLYVDLGFLEEKSNVKLHNLSHPDDPPDSLLAQIEMLAILWVRLWFAGIRLFTPKAKSLYVKFKADELLFFNSKNFDRAIMAMIKAMELVDDKLQVASDGIPSDHNLQFLVLEHGQPPTSCDFEVQKGHGYIRSNKKTPEVGGRPSFLEVAQQFASEIS